MDESFWIFLIFSIGTAWWVRAMAGRIAEAVGASVSWVRSGLLFVPVIGFVALFTLPTRWPVVAGKAVEPWIGSLVLTLLASMVAMPFAFFRRGLSVRQQFHLCVGTWFSYSVWCIGFSFCHSLILGNH